MKRGLSIIIVLAIVFGLVLPMQTYAADQNTATYTTISDSTHFGGAIKEDGSLWMWGSSTWMQGSTPNNEEFPYNLFTPTKVMNNNVKSFSIGGERFAAVIKDDNSLWIWGMVSELISDQGVTGSTRTKPAKVLDDVIFVDCGYNHLAAITSDHSLWLLGSNLHGQIGNGYQGTANSNDIRTGLTHPVQTTPQKIMSNVVAVSCGDSFTAAITSDGKVYTWGNNSSGQLGNGQQGNKTLKTKDGSSVVIQTNPVQIATNGKSVCCGENTLAVIKTDGSLWLCGNTKYYNMPESGGIQEIRSYLTKFMEKVKSADVTGLHTAIIKDDDSLWLCGYNAFGQLGNGTTQNTTTPVKIFDNVNSVSVSLMSTIILKNDGSVWTCGPSSIIGGDDQSDTFYEGTKLQTVPNKIMDGVRLSTANGATPPPDEPSLWAKDIVAEAIGLDLVPENLQKNYKQPVTRQEVSTMIVRLLERIHDKPIEEILIEKGVEVDPLAFLDTEDPNIFAINALGIITGFGNHDFRPNFTLTRAQAAVIINNIAKTNGIDTNGYTHDFVDAQDHWVNSHLGWPVHAGIFAGTGNGRFSPDGKLTVEQAITIFLRAYQAIK